MKQKQKGVRYIAQVLTRKLNKEYPKYNSALPEARRLLAQLKDSGEKVNQKSILNLLKKPKNSIEPKLPKEMLDEINYFNLQDYVNYIADTRKDVIFKSKIFPSSLRKEVVGGGNYSYEELFAPFVNYHNTIQSNAGNKDERYVASSDWVLVTTTPKKDKAGKWKKEKGKYVAEITYFSDKGLDYGWNPKNAQAVPPKEVIPEVSKTEKPTKKEEPKTTTTTADSEFKIEELKSKERIKLAELKLEEAKYKERISAAKELLKDKVVTMAEYMELIK